MNSFLKTGGNIGAELNRRNLGETPWDQAGLEFRLRARARQMLDVMTDGDTQTVICRSENSRTRLGTEHFTYRDDNS